jgi:hypothetical protein
MMTCLKKLKSGWIQNKFDPDYTTSGLSAIAASPRAAGRKTLFGRLK